MRIQVYFFVLLSLIGASIAQSLQNEEISIHREMLNLIETQPTKTQFKLWHYSLQRPYELNSEIGLQKYKVFKQNLKQIKESNIKYPKTVLGLGPFTDLTWEEFKETYLTYDINKGDKNTPGYEVTSKIVDNEKKQISFDELADADDNAEQNAIPNSNELGNTPDWSYLYKHVKSQGECGSCWAFATIGAIEGMVAKTLNISERYSEQERLDCDHRNNGCKGGRFEDSFGDIINNAGGVALEKDYHYIGYRSYCKNVKRALKVSTMNGCSDYLYKANIPACNGTVPNVIRNGPAGTGIEVKDGLQHYKDGEWLPYYCTSPNHAVVTVLITNSYVKIRNSWGALWGKNGYGLIPTNASGRLRACGSLNEVHQPTSFVKVY
jgi:hypothetical protein